MSLLNRLQQDNQVVDKTYANIGDDGTKEKKNQKKTQD